jgi:hypothetical protein
MKFLSLLATASMFLLPGLSHGQAPADSQRVLKIRCLSFLNEKQMPQLYAHFNAGLPEATGVPVNVKSYLNHESESLTVAGNEVIFSTEASRASIKTDEKVVGKMKVPANLRSAILMFLPSGGTEALPKCQIMVIDDSVRAFPRGSINVINLSHHPLRIELEKKPFDFKSGAIGLIEKPPVGEGNASAMTGYTFQENQWQRIGAGTWPHPGNKRVIQVAFDSAQSRQVEMRGIRDIAVREQ